MAKDVENLFEILDKIRYPVLIEKVDSIWMRERNCIIWNTDDNEEDLMNDDGMTYSGYIAEGVTEYEGYLVCNLDINTGTMITMFFDMKKEIKNG